MEITREKLEYLGSIDQNGDLKSELLEGKVRSSGRGSGSKIINEVYMNRPNFEIIDQETIERAKQKLPKVENRRADEVIILEVIQYGIIPYPSNPLDYPRIAYVSFGVLNNEWVFKQIKRHY